MKANVFLTAFIEELESLAGSLYYEDDIEEEQDVIRLELEEFPNAVFEVDTLLEHMDMYCVFSYMEYTATIREQACDFEEIERDTATYYAQKNYEYLLRSAFGKVDVWDDGCWGCRCLDINVGLSHVPCDIMTARKFIEVLKTNIEEMTELSNEEWRTKKITEILQKSYIGKQIHLQVRSDVDYRPLKNDNIVQYVGKEYVLYKSVERVAAITKDLYDFIVTFIDEMEFFSDYTVLLFNERLRFITCTYLIDIENSDYSLAVKTESLFFDSSLSRILLFLNNDERELLNKRFADSFFPSDALEKLLAPHIYTEGKTDCMHIKHAIQLDEKYSKYKWCFEDNSQNKHEKGDRELLSDCRTYCKDEEATHIKIAIFDRDGSIPIKDIEAPELGFKSWGNKVYSFALPVPTHRIDTPNISIEHYYSNDEIFKEYDVSGVMRRLFMGCEFDKIGRAPQIGRMRKTPSKCGPESISIIDCEVYDPNSSSDIDYALSKSKFAEMICLSNELSVEAKEAFTLLFEKIVNILKYDKDHTK